MQSMEQTERQGTAKTQGLGQVTSGHQARNIHDRREGEQQLSTADLPSLRTDPSKGGDAWTQEDLDSSSPFHKAAAAHTELDGQAD